MEGQRCPGVEWAKLSGAPVTRPEAIATAIPMA
jgi:hypothetical protein